MTSPSLTRLLAAALALSVAVPVAASAAPQAPVAQTAQPAQGTVTSQTADPAARPIRSFYDALLYSMKHAAALGPNGRFKHLEPAVAGAFDFELMTKFIIGEDWKGLKDGEQKAVVQAFRRLTTADYAHNFDGFGGESFVISAVEDYKEDKLVKTEMVLPDKAPISFIYRMHKVAAGWRIVDIYLNGSISEVAQRRADFASTLKTAGAKALADKLEQMADNALKGK